MCRRMKLVAPDLVRVPATMPTTWRGLDVAAGFEDLFGHVDELVGVAEALAEDGVGAPEEHGAVDDLLVRARGRRWAARGGTSRAGGRCCRSR